MQKIVKSTRFIEDKINNMDEFDFIEEGSSIFGESFDGSGDSLSNKGKQVLKIVVNNNGLISILIFLVIGSFIKAPNGRKTG